MFHRATHACGRTQNRRIVRRKQVKQRTKQHSGHATSIITIVPNWKFPKSIFAYKRSVVHVLYTYVLCHNGPPRSAGSFFFSFIRLHTLLRLGCIHQNRFLHISARANNDERRATQYFTKNIMCFCCVCAAGRKKNWKQQANMKIHVQIVLRLWWNDVVV